MYKKSFQIALQEGRSKQTGNNKGLNIKIGYDINTGFELDNCCAINQN